MNRCHGTTGIGEWVYSIQEYRVNGNSFVGINSVWNISLSVSTTISFDNWTTTYSHSLYLSILTAIFQVDLG